MVSLLKLGSLCSYLHFSHLQFSQKGPAWTRNNLGVFKPWAPSKAKQSPTSGLTTAFRVITVAIFILTFVIRVLHAFQFSSHFGSLKSPK